jgi:hypothetical protein
MASTSKIWQSVAETDGAGIRHKATIQAPDVPTLAAGESYSGIADVQILAAAVITLNATPVTVLAAPGAGNYYTVEWLEAHLSHQGVDYDGAGAGDTLDLKYTNASGDPLTGPIAGDVLGGASADAYGYAPGMVTYPILNAVIVAHLNVGEWYAAAGDGILNLRIGYTVHKAQA